MSAIYDVVADVISNRFEVDRTQVVPDISLDELGLDSLSQIELALVLKHRFGIELSDAELAEISEVADIVDRLEAKGARV
jgi:acyl carrier protein